MNAMPTKMQMVHLEEELMRYEDDDQRLIVLDRLASYYAFLNVSKANGFLSEMLEILDRRNFPDFLLNFNWNKAIIENQLYNFKVAAFHFKDAIKLVEERGNVNQQTAIYIDYVGTIMNLEQEDVVEELFQKIQKLLTNFPDRRLEARYICRQGFWSLGLGNYSKAIELFLEAEKKISALKETITLKDSFFYTLIYSGLGKIYEHNGEIAKSVKAYIKVVQMCENLGMRTRLSWHYLNVGSGFLTLGDAKSAEFYLKKAIRTTDDVSLKTRAGAYANLGFCYFLNQKYRLALELYDRAEELYKEKGAGDFFNFANIEVLRAHTYDQMGKKKKAFKHFSAGLEFSKSSGNKAQVAKILKEIAIFHAELGDYKNAYDYQVLHLETAEKSTAASTRKKMLELEAKYEAEKKERETELLRLQATKLQLKALRAQMNPHFVFNALNSIQSFISVNNVTEASKYLSKFAYLMRQSLEYSDLEIISLEKEVEFLDNYLTINAKLRFEDRLSYKIAVSEDIEEDIMGVPTMIVQPYVENAIEHGLRHKDKGLIQVSFSLTEDEEAIICVIEDNGVGRAKARELKKEQEEYKNFRSLGTSITEQRLELLHKANGTGKVFVNTIDLQDDNGYALGTKVEIFIPIVEIQMKS